MPSSKGLYVRVMLPVVVLVGVSNVGAQDAMFVDSSGNVGVGINTPAKQLHIQGTDDSSLAASNVMIRIENLAGSTESRRMLELVNSGSPLLVYRNTSSGEIWSQNPVGGQFTITKGGTGQQEFQMDGGGNVTIQGSLTQNSKRSSKKGFGAVDANTVLSKLDQLAIEEWSYKHTPDSRHMSPMAEDFYATFGLGPRNGIAPTDLAGVALAASKALSVKTKALDHRLNEINALKEQNKRLEERLMTLEKRLESIAK